MQGEQISSHPTLLQQTRLPVCDTNEHSGCVYHWERQVTVARAEKHAMSCSIDNLAAMTDLVIVGCCQICHKRPATIFADTDPT